MHRSSLLRNKRAKRRTVVNIRSKLPPPTIDNVRNVPQLISATNELSIVEFTSRDFFYDSNSYYQLHEQVLKDREYVASWQSVICSNSHLFKDKVSDTHFEYLSTSWLFIVLFRQIVLDVRCGLGLLSMFAAIAGARHVYAIDKSNIVQLTRRIVRDNRFADKITIIQGSVAEINLPFDRVDIIISTFLGYISCIQKNAIYNWPLNKNVALLRFDTQRINLLWQLARRDHYGPW